MPVRAITYSDAVDTIFGMVSAVWNQAPSIVGYQPEMRWQGREQPTKPDVDKIWGRASLQIVTDAQASLANTNGQRLYHAKGLLYVQIFCPRSDADLTIGRQFAQFIREVFRTESPDGNIWFTNQKVNEQAPTKTNYPIMVSANFEYDNINGQANILPVIPAMIARGKHFPVEAIDGIRTQFTFVGIPSDPNFYLAIFNGQIQDGLPQSGEVLTLVPAPKPASPGFPADMFYAIW